MTEPRKTDSGKRTVTSPYDDPIVQACIDNGGHFWPENTPDEVAPTCTRCWFNPGWITGKVVNTSALRPIKDEPQG